MVLSGDMEPMFTFAHRVRHRKHARDDQHDRQQARDDARETLRCPLHMRDRRAFDSRQVTQVPEDSEAQNGCQGRKLSIRSRMLPPASSFSAVDIFDMSKPDEPEPSMHRSFQPPRARAAGCFSSAIQEVPGAGVKHPARDAVPSTTFTITPATAIAPPARQPSHGPHEATWNVGGNAIARTDAAATTGCRPRSRRASPGPRPLACGTTTPAAAGRSPPRPRPSTNGCSGPRRRAAGRRHPSASMDRPWRPPPGRRRRRSPTTRRRTPTGSGGIDERADRPARRPGTRDRSRDRAPARRT